MFTVEITGWNYGYNKVESTKLLAHEGHMGLGAAKAATDAILDGQIIKVEMETLEAAQALVSAFTAINAVAHVSGHHD